MINFLNDYTSKILFLSVFIGLIQMILPKGKLKSNVLFTSMIVITIVIVEPLVQFLNKDIDISKLLTENEQEYETAVNDFDYDTYLNEKIKETYEENLRNDIVDRLRENGYVINNIECECDENTLEPKSLKIEIETKESDIEPVRINISNNEEQSNVKLALEDKLKIKKIANEVYGIKNENIIINGN